MNMPQRITILPIVLATLVLSACAAEIGGPPTQDPTDEPTSEPTFDPSPSLVPTSDDEGEESMAPSVPSGAIPEELMAEMVDQAAESAGVDPSDVTIVTAEAVTWSDGSLGCPQEGMSYTQALVPGYRAVLEVDGEEMHFHASQSGDFRLCDDPQPPLNDETVDR